MQLTYTSTPYTIHYMGSLIKFDTHTYSYLVPSYHTLHYCCAPCTAFWMLGVFLCPLRSCTVLGTSYSEWHLQRTRLLGLSSIHRNNSDTFRYLYRHMQLSMLWNCYRGCLLLLDSHHCSLCWLGAVVTATSQPAFSTTKTWPLSDFDLYFTPDSTHNSADLRIRCPRTAGCGAVGS